MSLGTYETRPRPERALLVAVDRKGQKQRWTAEESLDELGELARTAGAEVVGTVVQRLEQPNNTHYVGTGKIGELAALRAELNYSLALIDDELTPRQQRNLEEALKVKVIDRSALILDIFARQARTREGQLQVELAQHEYLLPRLVGQWGHLERLGGGIGTRGPGESQLETDRRLIRQHIHRLQKKLDEVRQQRALYRRRRAREGLAVVNLVGYTNAGKSTLLNALTKADVLVQDRLFSTLDPVTRRLRLAQGPEILLTDTVGFIQKLPPTLVAAFRATFEELEEASLLLHVVDITHPKAAEQSQTVEDTLAELGLANKPRLLALNKIDRLAPREEDVPTGYAERFPGQAAVIISAARGWGLDVLLTKIAIVLANIAGDRPPPWQTGPRRGQF